MILLPFARLLIIWKMEMGRERTRYPLTMEFAITKNLINFQQKIVSSYFTLNINIDIVIAYVKVGRSSYSALKRMN